MPCFLKSLPADPPLRDGVEGPCDTPHMALRGLGGSVLGRDKSALGLCEAWGAAGCSPPAPSPLIRLLHTTECDIKGRSRCHMTSVTPAGLPAAEMM